jgi:hypothetical protein
MPTTFAAITDLDPWSIAKITVTFEDSKVDLPRRILNFSPSTSTENNPKQPIGQNPVASGE